MPFPDDARIPSASLAFTKLEGAGNDFVMLHEGWQAHGIGLGDLARTLCDRHRGVGGDGLLTIGPPEAGEAAEGVHLVMGFLNPDGSEAGMCGNGARCLAHHAWGLGYPHPLVFRKGTSRYIARRVAPPHHESPSLAETDSFRSRSGKALDAGWIRLELPGVVELQPLGVPLGDGMLIAAMACRPGTEHLVVQADTLEGVVAADGVPEQAEPDAGHPSLLGLASHQDRYRTLLQAAGSLRRLDQPFASGANVNLIRPIGENRIENLTFERGVEGFTLSCGTGAIAAALASHHKGAAASSGAAPEPHCEGITGSVLVVTDGGWLRVRFRANGNGAYTDIALEGPARTVFTGTFVMDTA